MEAKFTKKQGTKVLPKGYLFIGLLLLFLIEYSLIILWGFISVILTILKSYMMGLNIELSGATQFFLMFFDFAGNWLTVPVAIIYFVGIPVLCYFFIRYLYDIKQDLTEIKENYRKLIINQKD